jgi:tRNA G18 (ribose-2'-O)-methylase SpoU
VAAGREALGADPEAGTDYRTADAPPDCVLVLGSEGAGLRPRVRAACTRLVRIPMAGRVASLNIAVASGVLLFELRRTA